MQQADASYKANFPDVMVYCGDANRILQYMLLCDANPQLVRVWNGVPLPKAGDVDLILAGPPCQGFSLLNRCLFTYCLSMFSLHNVQFDFLKDPRLLKHMYLVGCVMR